MDPDSVTLRTYYRTVTIFPIITLKSVIAHSDSERNCVHSFPWVMTTFCAAALDGQPLLDRHMARRDWLPSTSLRLRYWAQGTRTRLSATDRQGALQYESAIEQNDSLFSARIMHSAYRTDSPPTRSPWLR